MDREERLIKLNNLWKILFVLLFGIILGILFGKFVLSQEESLVFKWQLCDSLNQTGIECDLWWDGFKSAFGITDEENYSNLDDYYNKTILDDKLKDIGELYNITESLNKSINEKEFDNTSFILTDAYEEDKKALNDRFNRLETTEVISSSNTSTSNLGVYLSLIFGGVLFLGVIIFVVYKGFSQVREVQHESKLRYETPEQQTELLRRVNDFKTKKDEQERENLKHQIEEMEKTREKLREVEELKAEKEKLEKELKLKKDKK